MTQPSKTQTSVHPIEAWRLANGLPLAEASRRLGIPTGSLLQIERTGRIRPSVAVKIERATNGTIRAVDLVLWEYYSGSKTPRR